MENKFLISAKNISYKINDNKLFHNLSFNLAEGEAIHICGENGSGKSTLLRILLGITNQTKGSIYKNLLKEVCFLGHKNAVKSYLSLQDNILLMELHNHPKLQKYINLLNLKKYLNVVVANLSFGQQKKLALLRVFLNNSELLILDEPFVGLDSDSQSILTQFLNNELAINKGLVYTSHILCDIESKIIILE
mgnify:FL=1